jgi:acetyl esterase/lipase
MPINNNRSKSFGSCFRQWFVASICLITFSLHTNCLANSLMGTEDLPLLETATGGEVIKYGMDPLQFGELYMPPGAGPFPVVVMVHGGCWLAEYDLKHIRALAGAIRDSGFAVWSLEYRRVGSPGGVWPATFLDIAAGTDYLRELAREHPLDLNQVVALGHSSGGHLSLWLGMRSKLKSGELHVANPLSLKGVLAMAPAVDIKFIHHTQFCGNVIDKLVGGSPEEVPQRYQDVSPVANIPLGIPHTILAGYEDGLAILGLSYFHSAIEAGDKNVRLVELPSSGHFEMINPGTSSWPIVRDALKALFR